MSDEDQDQNGSENQNGDGDGQGGETPPQTWDAFIGAQSEEVQGLFEKHVHGLKSALNDERDENRNLAAQLRDAAKGADSKTAAKLNDMAQAQDVLTRKAEFYEAASLEGCNNLRLAWIAATDIEAFDRKGNVDLPILKQRFPELFGQTDKKKGPPPRTDAGNGTGTKPGEFDMDAYIRQAAGR